MKYLFLFLPLFAFQSQGQDTIPAIKKSTDPISKHTIQLFPFKIGYISPQLSFPGELSYRYNFAPNYFVDINVQRDLLKSFTENSATPPYSNIDLRIGFAKHLKEKLKNNKLNIRREFNFSASYNYLQFRSRVEDFWGLSTPAPNIQHRIAAFGQHNTLIGMEYMKSRFKVIKDQDRLVFRQRFYFDYIFNLDFNWLTLYADEFGESLQKMDNTSRKLPHGVKAGYEATFGIYKKLGIVMGTQFILPPFIIHTSSNPNYVPRGGEGMRPYFVFLNLGLEFGF